jgi:Holliday junction resolvasome RuvABC ATP-dependent DNA helicase subunit
MKNRVEKFFLNIIETKIKEISDSHIVLDKIYIKEIIDFIKDINFKYYAFNEKNCITYLFDEKKDKFIEELTEQDKYDEAISIFDDEDDSQEEKKERVLKKINKKDEKKFFENKDVVFSVSGEHTDGIILDTTSLIQSILDKLAIKNKLKLENTIFDFNDEELIILSTISKIKKIKKLFSLFSSCNNFIIDSASYKLKNKNIKDFLIYHDLEQDFDISLYTNKKVNISSFSEVIYVIVLLVQELSKEKEIMHIEEDKYYKIFNNDYVIIENELRKTNDLFYKMEIVNFCLNEDTGFALKDTFKDLQLPKRLYDLKNKNKLNKNIKFELDKIIEENTRLTRLSNENSDSKKFNFYNEEDYYNLIKSSNFIENRDDKHSYNSESTFSKLMELSKDLHLSKGLTAKNPSDDIISKLKDVKKNFPNFNNVTNYIILSVKASIITKNMIKINPILLTGNTGVGKTNYCKSIAKCFDMNLNTINMQQVSHDFELCGLTYGYSTGDTGKIYKSIVKSNIINPIILLDELDKSQSNISGSTPTNALITALEPSTSIDYYENSLELGIDVSRVNWIATANDLFMIPKHLLSRFRVFKINNPSKEDSVNIINSVYRVIRSESLVKSILEEELTEITTLKIKSIANNPREMSFLLREAIDKAISEIDETANIEKISISPNHIVKAKKIYQ